MPKIIQKAISLVRKRRRSEKVDQGFGVVKRDGSRSVMTASQAKTLFRNTEPKLGTR